MNPIIIALVVFALAIGGYFIRLFKDGRTMRQQGRARIKRSVEDAERQKRMSERFDGDTKTYPFNFPPGAAA